VPPPINAGVSQYKVRTGVTKDNLTLIYNRSFSFGAQSILLFPPESYGDMKRLFDEANKSDNHTIALKQTADGKQ